MSEKQTSSRGVPERVPIEKLVLTTIGIVGVVSLVAVAPGIGPAFKLFGLRQQSYSHEYVRQAVYRLRRKGFLTTHRKNGRTYIRLTRAGQQRLNEIRRRNIVREQPKTWDGKWRIVTFDVGEYRRSARDRIRNEMQAQGFVQLQRSVWITPYECEEFVQLLKADVHIGKDVRFMRVEYLEGDTDLRKMFGLPRKR